MIKKNNIIDLKIDNCTLGGSGVGRYDGMAVFVPGAVDGDEIKAHILKVKSSYAYAKIHEIVTPSSKRIESACPVFLKCGGCSFMHINYEEEAKIKEEHVKDCFKKFAGFEPTFEEMIKAKNVLRYRNKAQYPVRQNGDNVDMGFYAPHSHRVVNCEDCLLEPKEFADILEVIKGHITKNNISCYNEENNTGLIRHIFLRKGERSGEIMVCPVINGNSVPRQNELIEKLIASSENIKSIVINKNKKATNVVLGEECETIYGKDYITDTLCGLEFRISPLSFYQVNTSQAEKLYNKAKEFANLSGEETVIDLYCGTGTIGLTMAKDVKEVIGVEIVEQAVDDAYKNAEINGISNARFICADAFEATRQLENEGVKPDVIILDPPRKGCSPQVIETVVRMSPNKVVYISCDPATLARDCKIFDENGYKVKRITTVDLFARTSHVETVVLMSII